MKKRIISLILTLAILVLTLVGCGYNYSKDDLSKYAQFDKAGFEAALATLAIEDGDFTTDEDTRAKRVLDAMYKALGDKADTAEKITEGTLGEHDILYYCYYITAEFDGATVMFVGDEMTTAKAKKVQLGLQFPTDLEAKVLEAAKDFDITDKAYIEIKTDDADTEGVDESKAKAGQIAYITYTYSYTETNAEGVEKVKEVTVTKDRVVLDAANPLHKALLADSSKIGSTVADFVDDKGTEDKKDDVSYTKAKIEWVESGAELTTFKEVTYDTDTTKKDTNGTSRNLKNIELTYHIYPVHFLEVDELTAENIVNVLYGANITSDVMNQILFGTDFSEKTEEEQKAVLDEYKFEKDGKELSFADFITNLKNLQTTYDTEKKALTSAETKVEEAKEDLKEAKEAVEKAGDNVTEKQTQAVTTAENALKVSEEVLAEEKESFEKAEKERNDAVSELLAKKTDMAQKITEGYEKYTYKDLESHYNEEIKTAVAKEVYALLEKYVTVNSVPKKAVDEAYDQMIQNYQHAFYDNETLDGDTEESNKDQSYYALYKGSFKNFLTKCVVPSEFDKQVDTYADAKAAVREAAEKIVTPVLRVYVASEAYGVTITNKQFKQLAEEDTNYTYNESLYGENTVRNAYQFDKLMDTILCYEETDGKASYSDKIAYTFKAEDAE